MFDKLNRDAFHIVSYFLFQTLDKSLTKEVFKWVKVISFYFCKGLKKGIMTWYGENFNFGFNYYF